MQVGTAQNYKWLLTSSLVLCFMDGKSIEFEEVHGLTATYAPPVSQISRKQQHPQVAGDGRR